MTHAAPCVVLDGIEAVAALAVRAIVPTPRTAAALARAAQQAGRAHGPLRTTRAVTQPSHLAEPCEAAFDH